MKATLGFISTKNHQAYFKKATNQLLNQLDKAETAIFKKFSKDRQIEVILGRLLAKHLICKAFDLKDNIFKISLSVNSKPKLIFFKPKPKNIKKIDFSISHSQNLIGCAVSDFRIGFDLQVIKQGVFLTKIANKLFDDTESSILSHPSNKKDFLLNFYRIWTMKEAHLKLNSLGIWQIKKAIRVDLSKSQPITKQGKMFNFWFKFNGYLQDQSFMCALCANKKFSFEFCEKFLPLKTTQINIAKTAGHY